MNDAERERRIRRILVALDASPHSLAALQAAAELASDLEAELAGLFVEDENLLRLAELHIVREMGLFSSSSRSLDSRYMQRQLRARARRAQQALARMAESFGVAWSFRTVRGTIATELLAAAAQADLTILGKAGWSFEGQRRLGSTTREVMVQTNRLTLILQRGARLGLPVLVVYDGSQVAHKALTAAVELMRGRDGELTVLVLADDADIAQDLQTQTSQWLQTRGLQARYRRLIGRQATVERLVHAVQKEGCRILVLPSPSLELSDEALQSLLERVDCPLLWVR